MKALQTLVESLPPEFSSSQNKYMNSKATTFTKIQKKVLEVKSKNPKLTDTAVAKKAKCSRSYASEVIAKYY